MALSCRILGAQRVTLGSFGHVSVRIPGTDRILIKAKGPNEDSARVCKRKGYHHDQYRRQSAGGA